MNNNNNKNQQASPNKSHRQYYPYQNPDRHYEQRRITNNQYPHQFPQSHQQIRNNAEHFNRMPMYPPTPQYYHQSFHSYPYAHNSPYAMHLATNPYNSQGRMLNPNPYYYPTHQQYPNPGSQQHRTKYHQKTTIQYSQFSDKPHPEKDDVKRRNDESKRPLYSQKHQDEGIKRERNNRKEARRQQQDQSISYRSYESSVSQSEQEEVFYKKKVITKRKDPVLDSKEEIRKWIEARRKNYPRKNLMTEGDQQVKTGQQQMSLLEKKIRKKLILINSDPRSIIKKQKDLDILRRFILYPRRQRRIIQKIQKNPQGRPLIQEIDLIQPIQPDNQKQNQKQPKALQNKQIQILQMEEVAATAKKNLQKQSAEDNDDVAVQVPIRGIQQRGQLQKEKSEVQVRGHKQLSVQVIINHLQMKQREDSKLLQNLMDYKSNSCQYRYQYQTLQTNLLLDNVFRDTSYMLQAIRYIVKQNFFQ